MSGEHSTNPGGAPGGMGASTGADPRGPMQAGGDRVQGDRVEGTMTSGGGHTADGGQPRSFAPSDPGHIPEAADGGGTMSGRGSEHPHGTGEPGQGGDHLMGRSGGQARPEDFQAAPPAGQDQMQMGEDLGAAPGDGGLVAGGNEAAGAGSGSAGGTGASASGDAHLGQDGEKLGDPMNARRQAPSDGANSGLANGSGAD